MNNKPDDVVICSAVRTPIGTYKGSLKDLKGDQLGTIVINEVLKRSKISNNQIDEVIMGQVLTAAGGQNPARQAAVNAGIPVSKPAYLVNQVCGSGLRAIISGYQQIKLGDANNVICGGQENMSMTPYSYFYSEKKEISKDQLINTMIHDGLTDAFKNYHMGVTAENVAKKFNISRKQQDEFALQSQKKTEIAIENNKFDDEIVHINHKGVIFKKDENPRKVRTCILIQFKSTNCTTCPMKLSTMTRPTLGDCGRGKLSGRSGIGGQPQGGPGHSIR